MSDPEILIGTIGYPAGKKLLENNVDVVESNDAFGVPPKAAAGKRRRAQMPPRIAFTVQLPRYLFESPPEGVSLPGPADRYGRFQATEENLGLMERAVGFAAALEARALVLLTPAAFTPAKPNIDALEGFLKRCSLGGLPLVWEPRGPWEHGTAAGFARAIGMTLAVDPLRDAPAPGENAYFRLGPFAAVGSRLGIYDLERLADACAGFERVICVFGTPRALDDLRNFRKILAEGR